MFGPCFLMQYLMSFCLLTVPRRCFFCGSFLLFMFHICLCYAVLSVPCSLVITCWEMAALLAILCVAFSFIFVTVSYGVLSQVWYLIVTFHDICLPLYFSLDAMRILVCCDSSARCRVCDCGISWSYSLISRGITTATSANNLFHFDQTNNHEWIKNIHAHLN